MSRIACDSSRYPDDARVHVLLHHREPARPRARRRVDEIRALEREDAHVGDDPPLRRERRAVLTLTRRHRQHVVRHEARQRLAGLLADEAQSAAMTAIDDDRASTAAPRTPRARCRTPARHPAADVLRRGPMLRRDVRRRHCTRSTPGRDSRSSDATVCPRARRRTRPLRSRRAPATAPTTTQRTPAARAARMPGASSSSASTAPLRHGTLPAESIEREVVAGRGRLAGERIVGAHDDGERVSSPARRSIASISARLARVTMAIRAVVAASSTNARAPGCSVESRVATCVANARAARSATRSASTSSTVRSRRRDQVRSSPRAR